MNILPPKHLTVDEKIGSKTFLYTQGVVCKYVHISKLMVYDDVKFV